MTGLILVYLIKRLEQLKRLHSIFPFFIAQNFSKILALIEDGT